MLKVDKFESKMVHGYQNIAFLTEVEREKILFQNTFEYM